MLDPEIEAAFHRLVSAIAGPDALPAGGAAGVAAIALGTALATKVLRLSPTLPSELRDVGPRLELILERVLPEFAADCAAFTGLLAAFRRPREDSARADTVRGAWRAATEAPARVAVLATEVDGLLAQCVGHVNPNLAADLGAARELVGAGRRIAVANARENAAHLEAGTAARLLATLPSDSGARRRD
jgi:formiminotetrahydrofolate cyclodeaminase